MELPSKEQNLKIVLNRAQHGLQSGYHINWIIIGANFYFLFSLMRFCGVIDNFDGIKSNDDE